MLIVQKRTISYISFSVRSQNLRPMIEQLLEIARLEGGRIGRRAHEQRPDEAAVAHDVARIAVIGFRIALREAREFAPVRLVIAVHGEIAAVAREDRAALIGENLQAVFRQFEIAHDLRAAAARKHRSSWNR